MVTKQIQSSNDVLSSFILAKNHMVTKRSIQYLLNCNGFILAKNHIVTKQSSNEAKPQICFILAKNHMVTKRFLTFV